jgi:hypothetical protein
MNFGTAGSDGWHAPEGGEGGNEGLRGGRLTVQATQLPNQGLSLAKLSCVLRREKPSSR